MESIRKTARFGVQQNLMLPLQPRQTSLESIYLRGIGFSLDLGRVRSV
jgi:hypothetical protein